jgi:GNAT superfamily N-acetyltransferase
MSITYRIAKTEDVPAIKALTDTMLMHTVLGTATVPKIQALVNSPKTLFMLACNETAIIGYVCAVVHESIFNDKLRVSDIGLFVLPDYRHTSASIKLVRLLEEWAIKQGASQIWLGQTTGDEPDRVVKFYNRLGYKTQGFNCLKEL